MGSESWHEALEKLSERTKDLHRAYQSVCEELQAADWYQQRIDVSADAELKAILAHNRDEEKEHASMVLEWIRRRDPDFARAMDTYLYSEGDVTKIEEREQAEKSGGASLAGAAQEEAAADVAPAFTVGSLKGT